MTNPAAFWDRMAEGYAARPIKDPSAYETTLERVRTYLSKDDTVLEVGCGTGSTALTLADKVASYTGTDISGAMIDIARRKTLEAGTPNLEFETASVSDALIEQKFDVILGFNLLHLLDDPEDAIAKMRNALNPGGYLITKTVCLRGYGFFIKPAIRTMQLFGKAPYVGFHATDDIDAMTQDTGFEIVETGNYPAKPPCHFVVARRA